MKSDHLKIAKMFKTISIGIYTRKILCIIISDQKVYVEREALNSYVLGEMIQNENSLLGRHPVLLDVTLVHQLFADRLENRLQQSSPEDEGRIEVRQRVAKRRNVTEHQPPCIINLVSRRLVRVNRRLPSAWSLEVPMIQAVQKHLGQIVHRLPIPLCQVSKFVDHKVGDGLGNAGLLERRLSQRALYRWLRHGQDALSQQLEQEVVHPLGVGILFSVHAHEYVIHVHDHAQQFVDHLVRLGDQVGDVILQNVSAASAGIVERGYRLWLIFRRFGQLLGIFPAVALALLDLARAVIGKFQELLHLGQIEDLLLALLDSLEIVLSAGLVRPRCAVWFCVVARALGRACHWLPAVLHD